MFHAQRKSFSDSQSTEVFDNILFEYQTETFGFGLYHLKRWTRDVLNATFHGTISPPFKLKYNPRTRPLLDILVSGTL